MTVFNKLVRDRIPQIMEQRGEKPQVQILSDERYLTELDKKLNEETNEYQASKELEELADILEVLYAICEARGYPVDGLHRACEEKRAKRGGFTKKLYLLSKE